MPASTDRRIGGRRREPRNTAGFRLDRGVDEYPVPLGVEVERIAPLPCRDGDLVAAAIVGIADVKRLMEIADQVRHPQEGLEPLDRWPITIPECRTLAPIALDDKPVLWQG